MGPAELVRQLAHGVEVAVDPLRLAGEASAQTLAEGLPALWNVEAVVADEHPVVAVRIELEEDEVVRDPEPLVDLTQPSPGPELADVVDAGAELEALERE